MAPTQTYLDTLTLYYEEEIEGEAYFAAIAAQLTDPDRCAKMQLMADVETYAAAAVLPLLDKHGLIPRRTRELHANGRRQAQTAATCWDALISGMRRSFPAYMDDFARLESMAPPADLPALKILTAHETAAINFLNREAAGDPDSAAPLRLYLETGTA